MEADKSKLDKLAYILMGIFARGILPFGIGFIALLTGVAELVFKGKALIFTAGFVVLIVSILQAFMLWNRGYHYILDEEQYETYGFINRFIYSSGSIVGWGIPCMLISCAACYISLNCHGRVYELVSSIMMSNLICGLFIIIVVPLALLITEAYRIGIHEPYIVVWEKSLFDRYIERYKGFEELIREAEEASDNSNEE